jgi:peptide/nickel transport system substrate-binding protein
LVQSQAAKLGVKVNIQQIEQGGEINAALGGKFQAILWRNHPGGDPDTQYVWWHSGEPTNFSKINDPIIDKDLDAGRTETDPAKRQADYEDLNREFAKQAYNIWTWWTLWTIGYNNKIHGILGPNLPDGKKPSPGLATGHFLGGIWKDK